MLILQGIVAWSIKRCVAMVAGVALLASASSFSASCFEVDTRLHVDSQQFVCDHIESNDLESEAAVAGSAFEFLKSGVSLLRNNPLKALTAFLAIQSQGSLLSIPSAEAQFVVTNTNQMHLYDINFSNPVTVALAPMIITGDDGNGRYYATILLSDKNAGNLTSTWFGLPQNFDRGMWNAQGDQGALTNLLSHLHMSISAAYNQAFHLSVEVYDQAFSTSHNVKGTIQILPIEKSTLSVGGTGSSSIATSKPLTTSPAMMTTGTTPEASSMSSVLTGPEPTTTSSGLTTPFSRPPRLVPRITVTVPDRASSTVPTTQDFIDSSASSVVSPIPATVTSQTITLTQASKTMVLSLTDTSDISSVGQASQSPDVAIIGGAVGGGVALMGCIAAVIVAKRGSLCGGTKKSAEGHVQDPEHSMRNQYGKIEVASNNEYALVGIPHHTYENGNLGVASKNEYDPVIFSHRTYENGVIGDFSPTV